MNTFISRLGIFAIFGLVFALTPAFADDQVDPVIAAFAAKAKADCEQKLKDIQDAKEKAAQNIQSTAQNPEEHKKAVKEVELLDNLGKRMEQLSQQLPPKNPAEMEAYARNLSGAMQAANVLTASSVADTSHASVVVRALEVDKRNYLDRVSKGFDGAGDNATGRQALDAISVGNTGTCAFCGVPVAAGGYQPPTVKAMTDLVKQYGVPPQGVIVEGTAQGLGEIDSAQYDAKYNALIINGAEVYMLKIPPWTFDELCKAIADDDRLGVTEETDQMVVYGAKGADKIYGHTSLAHDMALTDMFLGDIVFSEDHWSKGYNYAGGFRPTPPAKPGRSVSVEFIFGDFQFRIDGARIVPVGENLSVTLYPTSLVQTADGRNLPDYNALDNHYAPPAEYVRNAKYVAKNTRYFSREEIVARTFEYGEAASILRAIKAAGKDVGALAESESN